jgi:hypothetical protein
LNVVVDGERVGAVGCADGTPATSLSRSSGQMRSAVFLPTPGIVASLRASPRAMASARSFASMPERIFCASVGPMPEIEINFSNALFSSDDANPYNESASSRTCV